MLFAVAMDGSLPRTGDAADVVAGFEGDDTTVFVEETEGTKGNDGTGPEANGMEGIEGPSGTGLLTAVLVKVEVPDTLVRVGVARLSSLDAKGSCTFLLPIGGSLDCCPYSMYSINAGGN